MSYSRKDMYFDDYTWTAASSGDNPFIIDGKERTELNRTEGYEVLYFINALAEEFWGDDQIIYPIWYERIEKMLRQDVPTKLRNRQDIQNWIIVHWKD